MKWQGGFKEPPACHEWDGMPLPTYRGMYVQYVLLSADLTARPGSRLSDGIAATDGLLQEVRTRVVLLSALAQVLA